MLSIIIIIIIIIIILGGKRDYILQKKLNSYIMFQAKPGHTHAMKVFFKHINWVHKWTFEGNKI